MKILGITDGMTGGAALIEDGRIRCAINEERLVRKKMAIGFPRQAIARVLSLADISADQLDAVAVATISEHFQDQTRVWNGWFQKDRKLTKVLLLKLASVVPTIAGSSPVLRRAYYKIKAWLGRKRQRRIIEALGEEFGIHCPVRFIDHHFAHACSAYFTSGLQEATVITMDGAGDFVSSRIYSVRDGDFKQIHEVDSYDSIGNYYAYVTHLCGFKAHKHEGKITGLAAHGKPVHVDLLREFIRFQDCAPANKGNVFYWSAIKALRKALPDSFRREDLACSIQQILEEETCRYVGHWVEKTGCGDLALAGGVFANVKLNQRIHEIDAVDSLFIHPGMGDGGLAVGAALAENAERCSASPTRMRSYKISDVYLGPTYSDEEIRREIEKEGLKAERLENIEERIAELLVQGHVVARFDGAMEYGPRALGSRSILYQPTDPTVNDWLNKKLQRTEFMPFAPVTLVEHADKCYKNMDGARFPAQFMTITFDCTDWMAEHCPAVVHIDGTARPQTIARETNPSYYRIVEEYHQRTGLPCIINTSFNMHEEPIVCTPHDAIRAFKLGHLDYLAIGKYLIGNAGESPPETVQG